MIRTIKIPLYVIEKQVGDNATEQKIMEDVDEASVSFCLTSTDYQQDIEEEIEIVKQDFKIPCKEISERLSDLPYENGDIGDIGNEIGVILGKYMKENSFGWEKEDFISGLNHGISIANGTH
jgi:hypothetical protein